MLKRILIATTLVLLVTLTAVASDRGDDVSRTDKATQAFKEIMSAPSVRHRKNILGELAACLLVARIPIHRTFVIEILRLVDVNCGAPFARSHPWATVTMMAAVTSRDSSI